MKKSNNLDKLQKLVEPEMDLLKQNIIYCDDGKYHVFTQYTIDKQLNDTYLTCKQHQDPKTFSALRFAMSWCIADKYGKLDLATAIVTLDQQRYTILNNVKVRQHLAKKIQDPVRKEIVELKIANKKNGLVQIENQLTKCVNLAKYWQIKGFNCDETARTRHSQTTR
jgi:hypothetical protein